MTSLSTRSLYDISEATRSEGKNKPQESKAKYLDVVEEVTTLVPSKQKRQLQISTDAQELNPHATEDDIVVRFGLLLKALHGDATDGHEGKDNPAEAIVKVIHISWAGMVLLRLGFQFGIQESKWKVSFDFCAMIGNLVLDECIAKGVSSSKGVRRGEVQQKVLLLGFTNLCM